MDNAFEKARAAYGTGAYDDATLEFIFPELKESEDEKIIKWIASYIHMGVFDEDEHPKALKAVEWLEKQKEASKAIEAVERIDKYIDEHLANAHDMKDSNPDKKYYRGWDDALGKMAGILQDVYSGENQKEPHYTKRNELFDKCVENCDPATMKEVSDYVEKQKEQKPITIVRIPKFRVGDIIQHVPLEKWDRSRRITSIDEDGYYYDTKHLGDNFSGGFIGFSFEDEYELVEQKTAEWSEEDERMLNGIVERGNSEIPKGECGLTPNQVAWLKSLRPSWKPSEEQMKALEECGECKRCVKELYEQLKKII